MTPATLAALRGKETATRALVDALVPYADAPGFAALWQLVRAYGAACTALGAATARDAAAPARNRRAA